MLNEALHELSELCFAVDYLELRAQDDLSLVTQYDGQAVVLLAAAYLGKPRLLDNITFAGFE